MAVGQKKTKKNLRLPQCLFICPFTKRLFWAPGLRRFVEAQRRRGAMGFGHFWGILAMEMLRIFVDIISSCFSFFFIFPQNFILRYVFDTKSEALENDRKTFSIFAPDPS